jgi:hypothetical protein
VIVDVQVFHNMRRPGNKVKRGAASRRHTQSNRQNPLTKTVRIAMIPVREQTKPNPAAQLRRVRFKSYCKPLLVPSPPGEHNPRMEDLLMV